MSVWPPLGHVHCPNYQKGQPVRRRGDHTGLLCTQQIWWRCPPGAAWGTPPQAAGGEAGTGQAQVRSESSSVSSIVWSQI